MPKWGKGGRPKKSDRDSFLTMPELNRFLETAKAGGPFWYSLFVITVNLGLRISEALALTRESFRHLKGNAVVIETLKQKGGEKPLDTIYVDDDTKGFIERYVGTLPATEKYLFASGGQPVSRIAAWKAFEKYCLQADLNIAYTPHALRHTRGVILWQNTKDLQYVRVQLRHRSISSTSKYMHMDPDHQREMAAKSKGVS